MAKTSRVLPEVYDPLCRVAAAKMLDVNAQEIADTLWAMAKKSRAPPEVFDSLCRAAAVKMQDFNAQEVANMPRAMAKRSRVLPEVFHRREGGSFTAESGGELAAMRRLPRSRGLRGSRL